MHIQNAQTHSTHLRTAHPQTKINIVSDRHVDRQTDRETDRRTDRRIDTQVDSYGE